jgi:hypothetical protein
MVKKRIEKMPKKISSAVTTPQAFHKERHERGVDYYKEVTYTHDGKMILNGKIKKEKISISRATCNFSGAYPYLFDVISYVCTHAKKAIIQADNYYSVTIPYEKFLEFALDGCTGQLRYLQNELYRLDNTKQSKLIALNEKTSLYAMPVVLAYKAGNRKRPLSEKGERGAKQLGQEVHAEIQILFLKCLFQDIKENNNRYIDFPKAFFAKLKMFEKKVDNREPLTSIITAEVIYKFLNYFRLHDNGKSLIIRVKEIETLKHCVPQYIKTWKNKEGKNIDSYQNVEETKLYLGFLVIAINEVCRIGILNAIPEKKMRNLITRVEHVPSGDILIYYGNRKEKAAN